MAGNWQQACGTPCLASSEADRGFILPDSRHQLSTELFAFLFTITAIRKFYPARLRTDASADDGAPFAASAWLSRSRRQPWLPEHHVGERRAGGEASGRRDQRLAIWMSGKESRRPIHGQSMDRPSPRCPIGGPARCAGDARSPAHLGRGPSLCQPGPPPELPTSHDVRLRWVLRC
jgi:hypothetical protein